jgi:hypothetical protein
MWIYEFLDAGKFYAKTSKAEVQKFQKMIKKYYTPNFSLVTRPGIVSKDL